MLKQNEKGKKPLVLGSTPSANWKLFLTEQGNCNENPRKKFKISHHKEVLQPKIDIEDPDRELFRGLPEACAIDCEMVGVAPPQRDMLARVSIVNMSGNCIYDKYVEPTHEVTDYRTWVSGIRARDLKKGEPFAVIQNEVAAILKNKIVVGHAVGNDFRVLKLKHPRHLIRDTSNFPTFREMFNNKTPGLRNLARVVLGVNIQSGEHSSIQDAKATLQLYMTYRREWEEYIGFKFSKHKT